MNYTQPYYTPPAAEPTQQRLYQPPPTYSYPSQPGPSTYPALQPPPHRYTPYPEASPSYSQGRFPSSASQPSTPRPRAAPPPHIAPSPSYTSPSYPSPTYPSPTYPSPYSTRTEAPGDNPYGALGLTAFSPVTQYPGTPQPITIPQFLPSPVHPAPHIYTPRYLVKMESGAPTSPADNLKSTPVLSHVAPPSAPPSGASAERIHFVPNTYAAPTNGGSVGPSQVTIMDLGSMSGHPGNELSAKCEITFPPDSPSPTGPYPTPEEAKSPRVVRLSFGSEAINTSVAPMGVTPQGSHIITLRGQVPAWPKVARQASGPMVPVRIEIMLDGELESYLDIGEYKYESFSTGARVASYGSYSASNLLATNPLKRSGAPLESHRVGHMMHRRVMTSGGRYEHESPEMSHTQLPALYTNTPMMNHEYEQQPNSPWMEDEIKPAMPGMYPSPTQPNLQRATQIPGAAPITAAYSPVTKATLELMSDLPNMARGWSPEEWGDRRRLVQFWRRQTGTQITAYCHPITPGGWTEEQKKGGCIVVSCIYREETNMCYVTSVDAIYLLEALVGSRFTVEEKNRIRRNLEGFRPQTVSKTKPGSEEFFKLIMGFPNPKPRNIEKDVKVFPWDVLGQALKKIIGKYSASWAGGSPSPALSASSQLPPYGTPFGAAPTPLQPMEPVHFTHPFEQDASFDSAPPGLSTGPSSESIYPSGSMYSLNGPQTPQFAQHPHGQGAYPQPSVYGEDYHHSYPSAYSAHSQGHAHPDQHDESPTQSRSKTAYATDMSTAHDIKMQPQQQEHHQQQQPQRQQQQHHQQHQHIAPANHFTGDYVKASPGNTTSPGGPGSAPGAYNSTGYYGNMSEPVSPTHAHGASYGVPASMTPYPHTQAHGQGQAPHSHGHGHGNGQMSQPLHHSTNTVHGEAHTLVPAPSVDSAQMGQADPHSRQTSGELRVMYSAAAH